MMADKGLDAGRTSGGGNLGHDQPRDGSEQTDIRNGTKRRPDSSAKDREAGRLPSDPVMPDVDATLKTKI
jgi:hypothetical protein